MTTETTAKPTTETPCFQLKGSMFTLSVLQMHSTDMSLLEAQLSEKIKLAPKFFQNAPVVIDVAPLGEQVEQLAFAQLQAVLRQHHLVPVGVRGADEALHAKINEAGLATLTDSQVAAIKQETQKVADAPKVEKVEEPGFPTTVITQPIRSGQQIYLPGQDLVIVSSVSPGAELLSDGNIHVYGTLRGRALAGINGNDQARIFCQSLEAELVSIAGQYKIFEQLDEHYASGPTQLYLDEGQLVIEALS